MSMFLDNVQHYGIYFVLGCIVMVVLVALWNSLN